MNIETNLNNIQQAHEAQLCDISALINATRHIYGAQVVLEHGTPSIKSVNNILLKVCKILNLRLTAMSAIPESNTNITVLCLTLTLYDANTSASGCCSSILSFLH